MVCAAPRKCPPWPTSSWAPNAIESSSISSGVNSCCSICTSSMSMMNFSKPATSPPSSQPAECMTQLAPARNVGSSVISAS